MALTSKFDDILYGLRLQPSLKYKLLETSLCRLTGIEVARTILWELGRMDVKVCCTKGEQNCYSPMLNFVGLSANAAGSDSVIASAIAAHELGHALQPRIIEKLGIFFKSFYYLSFLGEMFILLVQLFKALFPLISSIQSEALNQSSQSLAISQYQQHPQQYRLINPSHLVQSVIMLLKWVVILLLVPINFLTGVVFGVIFGIVFILSICCALIFRCLIFLIEIHASLIALRLLKRYKVLDKKQQNDARQFLFSCALTYLRSSSLDRLLL